MIQYYDKSCNYVKVYIYIVWYLYICVRLEVWQKRCEVQKCYAWILGCGITIWYFDTGENNWAVDIVT